MSDPDSDKAAARKVVILASLSLATMMVDFVWLIRDEVGYVWPKLRTTWTSRMYMLTRYLGVATQIYNLYFAVRMYLGIYTSARGCQIWFMYQALVVQILLATVEGLLMHRLYALFLRSRLILLILITFAAGQIASMWVTAQLAFPSNKHTVTCLMVSSNPGNAYFSATTMTTNLLIFFMTFWRYLRLPVKWTQHGLGRVVFRDSALSLIAISTMMLFLTLCSLKVIKPSTSGNITFHWLVALLWISIGRIIVNHEKIPPAGSEQGEGNTWKGTLQLTSQIEMGEGTLSVDTQSDSPGGHSPTSETVQGSASPKANQLSPSGVIASEPEGSRNWLGDPSPICGQGRRQPPTSRPSSTELPMKVSMRRVSSSNVRKSSDNASQSKDHPQPDAERRGDSPILSPQLSNSELPSESQVSS